MRIGIIALLHETNTFVSEPTTLANFEREMLLDGEPVHERCGGTDHEIGGFFRELDRRGVEAVPVFAARALPSGTVTEETYRELRTRMLDALSRAGRLDGLLLAPHGATVAEVTRDVDGDWMTTVREAVGDDVPIVATADPHANLSAAMVDAVDGLIAYRTNPHLDQRDRGVEAAAMVCEAIAGRIAPVTRAAFPPLILPIDRQCTDEEPCASIVRRVDAIRERPGVLSASLFLGFPYADVPEMGTAFAVVTDGDAAGADRAGELADGLWADRETLRGTTLDVAAGVDRAETLEPPVLLLDMGDNVGGGSPADGTWLAHELHRRRLGPSFVCLRDPEAVAASEAAGVGASVPLAVGGKTDDRHGPPLEATFTVDWIGDGRFTEPEPRHGGMRDFDQGRTAIVRTDTGLTVMLTTHRMVPFSLHQLSDLGVDPTAFRFLVAKGVNAPLGAYRSVCPGVVRVDTPGSTSCSLDRFTYDHRRRPMFPFEE